MCFAERDFIFDVVLAIFPRQRWIYYCEILLFTFCKMRQFPKPYKIQNVKFAPF